MSRASRSMCKMIKKAKQERLRLEGDRREGKERYFLTAFQQSTLATTYASRSEIALTSRPVYKHKRLCAGINAPSVCVIVTLADDKSHLPDCCIQKSKKQNQGFWTQSKSVQQQKQIRSPTAQLTRMSGQVMFGLWFRGCGCEHQSTRTQSL